jgi:hypothetical protein
VLVFALLPPLFVVVLHPILRSLAPYLSAAHYLFPGGLRKELERASVCVCVCVCVRAREEGDLVRGRVLVRAASGCGASWGFVTRSPSRSSWRNMFICSVI